MVIDDSIITPAFGVLGDPINYGNVSPDGKTAQIKFADGHVLETSPEFAEKHWSSISFGLQHAGVGAGPGTVSGTVDGTKIICSVEEWNRYYRRLPSAEPFSSQPAEARQNEVYPGLPMKEATMNHLYEMSKLHSGMVAAGSEIRQLIGELRWHRRQRETSL